MESVRSVLVGVLLCAAAMLWAGPGPSAATGETPTQPEVIAAIQARLAELGYYRGQTDGIVGQMTREAIRRYERQVGLEPTGTPSLDVYRRLRESASAKEPAEPASAEAAPAAGAEASAVPAEEARPSVSADAAPPGEAAEAVNVSGASWRFADADGAVFTVSLRPDGKVGGVPFSDSWAWKQAGDSVELRYANRLGRTVTRQGTLVTANSIAGTATSSAGEKWAWTAERVK